MSNSIRIVFLLAFAVISPSVWASELLEEAPAGSFSTMLKSNAQKFIFGKCPTASRCLPPPCGCPDDYCPKCIPTIRIPKYCGLCNDYCPKCPPCVSLPRYCGLCDDYVRKCPPRICWPCSWPTIFKCLPAKGGAKCQPAACVGPCGMAK